MLISKSLKVKKGKFISDSIKGQKRIKNQDSIMIFEQKNISVFIIFDGVSSIPTSYEFIEVYSKKIKSRLDLIELNAESISIILYESHTETIKLGIAGMSTVAALILDRDCLKAKFLNIGDSRIYIYNKEFIEQITFDDSLPGSKNIITKCLGMDSLLYSDFSLKEVDSNYNFLLCTDGFYELMENKLKKYFEVLNFKKFRNIERNLFSLQQGNNRDDSSYILIKNEISS